MAHAETLARRDYLGFDREIASFDRVRTSLCDQFPGKYVAIVGDEVEGPCDSFRDALRSGYARFGLGPLYIKQLVEQEVPAEFTRDTTPWRS